MQAEDSTVSSTGEASRYLVSAGGSGALAFGFLPVGAAGGVGAARAFGARGVPLSIALRGAARAPAPRRRVTTRVGEAGWSGRAARLPKA